MQYQWFCKNQHYYDGPIKKITELSVVLSNPTESLDISYLLSYDQTYIDNSNNKYDDYPQHEDYPFHAEKDVYCFYKKDGSLTNPVKFLN